MRRSRRSRRLADAGRDPGQWRRAPNGTRSTSMRSRDRSADFVVVPRAISAHLVRGVARSGRQAGAGDDRDRCRGARGGRDRAGARGPDRGHQRPSRRPAPAARRRSREPISAALQMIVLARARSGRRGVRRRVQRPRRPDGFLARSARRAAARLRRQEPDPPQPDRALPPRLRADAPRRSSGRARWSRRSTAAPSASRTR